MNKKLTRVCLHLTLTEILAETVSAMLTSLAKVKLAKCKQNLARPWLGYGKGASVNRVYDMACSKMSTCPDNKLLKNQAQGGHLVLENLVKRNTHTSNHPECTACQEMYTVRQVLIEFIDLGFIRPLCEYRQNVFVNGVNLFTKI